MAKTIDEKIVVLKFDNSNFERNTKQSMSTLDKLKAKLNFDGASKSLDNISKSASKVDMKGLSSSVAEVSTRFSALEVIGVTALANITNSAVEAGKAILSSITIDPIKAGWNKMGDMMGNVQTLVNATGKTTEEIEDYLETLMWYSDETSYGFTDMTSALANMAASGGKIEKLIPMIMGIANATAFAGKGAAEFSRIIYNLNQSYGMGYLTAIDWRSVEMAGGASKQLKQVIIDTAKAKGEFKGWDEKAIPTVENFSTKLKDKWATKEVLEEAFGTFSSLSMAVNQAYQQGYYYLKEVDENGEHIKKTYTTASKAIEDFVDNGARASIDDLNKSLDKLAIKGFRSAQEAKKFSEVMEATADATSSAWLQVFKSIFGGYEEQKRIWTDLANYLYDIFVEPIYTLQEKIENALDFSVFDGILEKVMGSDIIQGILKMQKAMQDLSDKVKVTTHSYEDYLKIVTKVWRGDFNNHGDNPDRFDLLTKAGYDWRVVQSLVNKTDRMAGKGNGWKVINKLTKKDVIDLEKKYKVQTDESNDAMQEQVDITEELNKALENLTDEQLEKMGLDEDEISLYRQLVKGASKYGDTIERLTGSRGIPALIDLMTTMKGRDLLFGAPKLTDNDADANELGLHFEKVVTDEDGNEVFQTIGAFTALLRTFRNVLIMVKDAWAEVFHFDSVDLYMTILKFQEFTNHIYDMTRSVQGMKNLKDTFKGLFAILKLITNVIHAPLKIAWTIFKTILETCGMTVLEFTGSLGNLISKFVDFIVENEIIIRGITQLTKVIAGVIIKVYQWLQSQISLNRIIEKITNGVKKLKDAFKKWIDGMKGMSFDEKIDYIIDSFVRAYNRVKELISKKIGSLPETLLKIFNKIKMAISNFFGGMGEAKQSGKLGSYIVQGLINGLKGGTKGVLDTIKNLVKGIINVFATMLGIHSPSKVFMTLGGFLLAGLVIGIRDSGGDVLKAITNLGNGILDRIKAVINWIFDLFGSSGNALLKTIKQIDLNNIISGLLAIGGVATLYAFAKGLGVLANGLKNIVDLAESTALVMKKFAGVLTGIKYRLIGAAFHDLARGILEIAIAVLILSKVDSGKMWEIFGFILSISLVIGALVWVISALTKVPDDKKLSVNMLHVIGTIIAISVGMLLMAIALKKLSSLKMTVDGAILIAGLLITFIVSLTALTKFKSSIKDVGTMMLGIGVAFFLISKAFKTLADLDGDALLKVAGFTLILGVFIAAMMWATQLLGRKQASIEKLGSMMMKIGVTFILIAIAVKMIGNMKPESFEQAMKAIKSIGSFVITLVGLALIGQGLVKGGKVIENIGKMMLQIGASFLLISIAIGILGKMKLETLIQGFVGIAIILGLILGFIYLLKKMDVKEIAKVGATMAGVALAVVGIAIAFLILSFLDWGDIFKGLIAVAGIFAGLAIVFKSAAGLKLVSYKSILAIAAVVAVLAIALAGLSFIDPERLVMPMMAMISVMLTVSVLMKSISKIGDPKKTILNLLSIAAFVVILGGVITGLSFLDPVGALAGVIAISALMLVTTKVIENVNKMRLGKTLISKLAIMVGFMAMVAIVINTLNGLNPESVIAGALGVAVLMATCAGILIVLDKLAKGISIKDVILGVVGLVAVLGACWVAIQVLKTMNGIDNVEQKVAALVTFMIGMSLVLIITALVGTLYTVTAGIAATGLIGLAVLLVICVGVIEVLQAMNGVQNAEKNADILVTFLGKLSVILLQIGIIAPLALMAVAAIGALMTLITIFGVIITAFGALIEKFPMLETFVDTGIKLFIKMAEGLGEILAAFVTGFLSKTMELLPMIGQKLSEFMINATPFIIGCKLINGDTLKAVGILVASILALTVTSLIEGIVQFLPFSKSFADMGKDLADFMANAMPFIEGVRGIDPIALECVGNLATAILKLTAANLLDQLAAFLGSRVSLADFGREIAPLGTAMRDFISNIGTFGDAELQTTEVACKALAELADAGSKMRKTGGLKQFFGGTEEDLGSFAIRLPIVAAGIKSFINTLTDGGKKGFGESQLKTVESGAKVVKTLAEAAGKIPDNGFSFKKLVAGGDSGDIEEFVQKFPAIARAIRKFVDVLNGNDIDDFGVGGALSGAMKDLIGNDTGESFKETTDNTFKMSEDISKALEGIGKFIEALAKLGEIDDDELEEVTKLASEKLPAVGRSIRGFIEALNGEDLVTLMGKKTIGLDTNVDASGIEHTTELAGEQTKNIVTLATELIKALSGFNGMDHNDLEDFYKFSIYLPQVGAYLNSFIDALVNGFTIDKKKVGKPIDATQAENIKSLVESAGTMINSLAGVGSIDFDKIKGKMPQYKTDLTKFAEAIKEFVTKMNDVTKEDLDEAAKKIDTIKTISTTLTDQLESQVKDIKTNFMEYLNKNLNFKGIISDNDTIKKNIKEEASSLLSNFKTGLDDAKINNKKASTAIRDKMIAVANDAIIGLEGTKDKKNDNTTAGKAKKIGENILQGLYDGLSNTGKINSKAKTIGQDIIKNIKEGAGVQSPSKYTRQTGNYVCEGLIIGIEEYSSRVYDTSSNVGKLAANGLNEAVASMSSLIETGIDSEPTIRPVLDLSNVQNGISSMNSMFDNSSIGVLSNLRTVSSEMNSRNQNGRNSDVVSAINKLGNTLNDSPKNTYNINGITYDGDSAVNQAVQQLINAIEIERRV